MDEIEFGGGGRPRSTQRTIAWSAAVLAGLGGLVMWQRRDAPLHPAPTSTPTVLRAARISVDSGWSAVSDSDAHRFVVSLRVYNSGDVPTQLADYFVDHPSSMTIDRVWLGTRPIDSVDAAATAVAPTSYTLPGQATAFLIISGTVSCPPGQPETDSKLRLTQDGKAIEVDLSEADWQQAEADNVCHPTY